MAATTPRPVKSGDTLRRPGARSAEADRVSRRTSTAHSVQALAANDVLAEARKGHAA